MKVLEIIKMACLIIAFPIIVASVALFLVLFGDPIEDALGEDW